MENTIVRFLGIVESLGWWWVAIVSAILLAEDLLQAVISRISQKRRQAKKSNLERFEQVFGFTPPSPPVSDEEFERDRKRVDATLKTLAVLFADADLAEREAVKALAEAKNKKGRLVMETREIKLADRRAWVKAAKNDFWNAHKLAEWAGFFVWSSYVSYLPHKLLIEVSQRQSKGEQRKGPPREIPGPKPYLP